MNIKLSLAVSSLFLLVSSASAAVPTEAKYGGSCAYTLATKNEVMKTDCKVSWTSPEDKAVYCFGNEKAKEEFAKNIKSNVKLADTAYKTVESKVQLHSKSEDTMDSMNDGHAMMKKSAADSKDVLKDSSKKIGKSANKAYDHGLDAANSAKQDIQDSASHPMTK